MNKRIIISFWVLAVSLSLYSQAPEGFSYHATVRNDTGLILANQPVSFRFRIMQDCPTCTLVYEEVHYDTTNNEGLVYLIIGYGTDTVGNFKTINWGSGTYFLNTGLDTSGGTTYADMGTSQFLSIPYALYSNKAGNGFSGNYNDLTNKPITNGSETKIKAGVNITLSGIGTIANPYIINSETTVTAGENTTVTGTGTTSDPYIIGERIHYVGESFGGGIIFYVYDGGRHGLIASTTDQDQAVAWDNGTKRYTNTTGEGVNAGEMNTTLIIALQTNDNPVGNFAAKVCADYSVKVDGITFGDWYLPSKHELAMMFNRKDILGNFENNYYWSSTEFSSVTAWCENFSTGVLTNLNKSMPFVVRAIRSF